MLKTAIVAVLALAVLTETSRSDDWEGISFSSNGFYVIARYGFEPRVVVWSVDGSKRREIATPKAADFPLFDPEFVGDESKAIFIYKTKTEQIASKVIDIASGKTLSQSVLGKLYSEPTLTSFSPSGTRGILGSRSQLYNLSIENNFSEASGPVPSRSLKRSERIFALDDASYISFKGGTIYKTSTLTGDVEDRFEVGCPIYNLILSDDRMTGAVICDTSGGVFTRIVSINNKSVLSDIFAEYPGCRILSPTGDRLYMIAANKISAFDTMTGAQIYAVRKRNTEVTACGKNSFNLLAASEAIRSSYVIGLYDAATGTLIRSLR